jgi:hypothetical protein
MAYKSFGNVGYYNDTNNLISFQIGDGPSAADNDGLIDMEKFDSIAPPVILNVGKHNVLSKGTTNNLPREIKQMISGNRLLPELIEKKIRILYGKGPHIYKRVFENGKVKRDWQENSRIEDWLDSWQAVGLTDDFEQYFIKVLRDVYHFDDYWVRWRYTRARRINGALPVAGLEHIENERCRLATRKQIRPLANDFEDRDFQSVVVGNWYSGLEKEFKVYKRFRPSNPTQFEVAVSYHKNASVGEIYGMNKFYQGIKDWLIGTNRNPQYINSYLENSLNAKVHVIIPHEWVQSIEQKIRDYVEENKNREDQGLELIKIGDIEIGTNYSVHTRDKYIAKEMSKLSKFLSGVKNQGKLYATFSYQTEHGEVSWQIKPIDLKYREFITALTDYDERADEVILSSIGMPASVSNITKEGIISVSGADLYYNYVIYLHNLTIAERLATEAVNQAIKVNFPDLYKQGYRVGLYNEIPAKQSEVSPGDRLTNSVNNTVQQLDKKIEQQNQRINQLQTQLTDG